MGSGAWLVQVEANRSRCFAGFMTSHWVWKVLAVSEIMSLLPTHQNRAWNRVQRWTNRQTHNEPSQVREPITAQTHSPPAPPRTPHPGAPGNARAPSHSPAATSTRATARPKSASQTFLPPRHLHALGGLGGGATRRVTHARTTTHRARSHARGPRPPAPPHPPTTLKIQLFRHNGQTATRT